jgi:hypothetical protein
MKLQICLTEVTKTKTGSFQCKTKIELVTKWPELVDSKSYVEWDDSDLGISGLFDDWDKPGQQQKWTLLLKDATLCNETSTLQGCVVETFDRDHGRDRFSTSGYEGNLFHCKREAFPQVHQGLLTPGDVRRPLSCHRGNQGHECHLRKRGYQEQRRFAEGRYWTVRWYRSL